MNPYEQRRRRVLDQLQFGEMMVLYSGESVASSMDEGFEFEANHHFFYLTGLRRENMALVLANTHHPAHVILFIEEPIPDMERWTGRRVTIDEAKAVSGIDDVRYIDSVESLISRCVARETVEAAYFDCYRNAMGDTDSYNMQKAKRFAQQYPTIALKNAHTMLSAMRMVKDEDEIKTLERAIAITDQGLRRVLATLEPGRMEYQEQAEFEYEIRMRGAERVSFPTIAGSGINGCMLHYGTNHCKLEDGKLLLLETVSYAESSMCRRKTLLHYFGEDYTEDNCGNCDNCRNPKPKVDARAALKMALEALRDIGDKFKADYLVNVLVGKTTALIKSYGHNKSKWFGAGAEHDARFWGAVLRQALILGLIDKNIENYGLISVNKKGEGYIALPFPVTVTLDHDYDEEEKESESVAPMGKGGAADEELFSMLKDLRKKVAKQHGLPPFVIFQDPSLEDMAVQYPITFEEMQNITGVGVGKARKFGEEFIRLIKAYVDEKEIIRPQDMIVKGVASKSGNKIFIIQSIDRKMDFEDIARAKDLDFDELLTEIEGIVNAGTKLDISYYLKEFMDEDKIEDIYLYFKEDAESDSLDAAIEELGADYTEEEIRLVRIKFMCEQGN